MVNFAVGHLDEGLFRRREEARDAVFESRVEDQHDLVARVDQRVAAGDRRVRADRRALAAVEVEHEALVGGRAPIAERRTAIGRGPDDLERLRAIFEAYKQAKQ